MFNFLVAWHHPNAVDSRNFQMTLPLGTDKLGTDELLEAFEDAWKTDQVPDLLSYLQQAALLDDDQLVVDLAIADIQHRCQRGQPELLRGLDFYRQHTPRPFTVEEQAEILAHEYCCRNRWGPAITRREIFDQHPQLWQRFLKHVRETADDLIHWPELAIRHYSADHAHVPLDRPVVAGRQTLPGQQPWSISTSAFEHHVTLCEMLDPTLSRQQLEIQLRNENTIVLRNPSQSRAIDVRGIGPLDAQCQMTCPLDRQIDIRLTGPWSLQIRRSGK